MLKLFVRIATARWSLGAIAMKDRNPPVAPLCQIRAADLADLAGLCIHPNPIPPIRSRRFLLREDDRVTEGPELGSSCARKKVSRSSTVDRVIYLT